MIVKIKGMKCANPPIKSSSAKIYLACRPQGRVGTIPKNIDKRSLWSYSKAMPYMETHKTYQKEQNPPL